jgi:formyl-CoA transferase
LARILQETFINTPAAMWASLLAAQGVPAAAAQRIDDLFATDQHCSETGIFETQQHPQFGRVKLQGVVPEFSDTSGNVRHPAPMLGEHTEEVLLELGYTRKQIEGFEKRGLVVQGAGA